MYNSPSKKSNHTLSNVKKRPNNIYIIKPKKKKKNKILKTECNNNN